MTTARGASSGVPVTMAATTTKPKVPRARIPRIVGRSPETLIRRSIASERDRNGSRNLGHQRLTLPAGHLDSRVEEESMGERRDGGLLHIVRRHEASTCLLYTSDAADEEDSVDL